MADLSEILGLGALDEREEKLRRQLAQAQALRAAPPRGATVLGGLSSIIDTYRGIRDERAAERGLAETAKQRAAARGAYLPMLLGAKPEQQRDAAFLGIASGDKALGALGLQALRSSEAEETRGLRLTLEQERAEREKARREAQDAAAKDRQEKNDAFRAESLGLQKQRLGLAQKNAADKAANDAAKADAPFDASKIEASLRREINNLPISRQTSEVEVANQKIQTASPSASGDMALVFGFMRILDPGSSVKEGEYANAQNAAGVPDRIRNLWNKVKDGELLSETQRAEFKAEAKKLRDAQMLRYKAAVEPFRRLAEEYRANPRNVVLYGDEPEPAGVATPPPPDNTAPAPIEVNGEPMVRPMPASGFVLMERNGKRKPVPASDVERMKALGAKVVE